MARQHEPGGGGMQRSSLRGAGARALVSAFAFSVTSVVGVALASLVTVALASALAGAVAVAVAAALALAAAPRPAFAASAATFAVAPATSGLRLRDDRGATIVLPAVPTRIVSLLPSLTESICALGGCGSLVGTDRYSNFPASVIALPKLGGIDDAQIERIVALKPDVVLSSASSRVTGRLESLGLKVLVLESRSRAEVEHSLLLLAAMLGTPAAADRVSAAIEREIRLAADRVPAALRGERVYFEVDATPYAAGAGSFIGETLARLGMANAVPAELGPFPRLNPEYVVRARPDIIMAGQRELDAMAERPGWSSLRALRDGKICGFANDRYELLVRPGPRMGEAAGVLADCLVALGRLR